MSETIQVKVNRISGYDVGQVVEVDVCKDGVPLEKFWRRRLEDSASDDCCEVVDETAVEEPQANEPEAEAAADEEPES